MTAGRELDALVAEKVMHLKRAESWFDVPGWEICADEQGLGPYYKQPLPPYSTSIAAAWAVVEHSNAFFEMFNNPIRKIWAVKFEGQDEFITADTAPLAICLAALKAVGVEVPA